MDKKLTFPSKATRSDSSEWNPHHILSCGRSVSILPSIENSAKMMGEGKLNF